MIDIVSPPRPLTLQRVVNKKAVIGYILQRVVEDVGLLVLMVDVYNAL